MAASATKSTTKSRRTRSGKPKKSRTGLWTLIALLLLLAAFFGYLWLTDTRLEGEELRLDTFVDLAERGRVDTAHILDQDAAVVGTYTTEEGEDRAYYVEYLQSMSRERLIDVTIENRIPTTIDRQFVKSLQTPITFLLGILMLVTVFVYMVLSYRSGTGLFQVFSGARKIRPEDADVTFADVAGQDAAIEDIRELVGFLADPERYAELGAQPPKGMLLYGPPGCGKTMIAKALAGESGANFYSISGSDFVELYVGVGAARVRDLFNEARENAPSIIFIDELDSVGQRRTASSASGSGDEQEQALNQILAEMDGFGPRSGVLVIGASNRPDVLDPALLRPGRFDRTVGLERPGEDERLDILRVHAREKRLAEDVDLAAVARKAIGFSGADLANVMNEGALLASRAGKHAIGQDELEKAVDGMLRAPERQRRLSLRDRSVGHQYGPDDRITFADVAGVDEVVEELLEIREYLAYPGRFTELGAEIPKGVLLDGPPGVGKTLMARALAGEANAAFMYVAATEFVEVFVGEGAARVRDLFTEAQSMAPAILFIDEIDAIGGTRGVSNEGSKERENTLNQILTELDGFSSQAGVIVVAATNRPDMLDPALTRPGRFDRHVTVTLPDRRRRREILDLHARNRPLADDVDLDAIAALTPGCSGADLHNLLNEASLLAARRNQRLITAAEVDEALARSVQGISPTRTTNEAERAMVAYHEAGHAITGYLLEGAKVPHHLTIIPRGRTLGSTWNLDEEERSLYTRSVLIDQIAGLLGGRVAEEMVFDEPSSGAHNDLERVSQIARRMVTELGMGTELGAFSYAGGGLPRWSVYSEEEGRLIHTEIRRVIDEAYQRATAVLDESREALDAVADALLERETLTSAEFEELVANLLNGRPSGQAARTPARAGDGRARSASKNPKRGAAKPAGRRAGSSSRGTARE